MKTIRIYSIISILIISSISLIGIISLNIQTQKLKKILIYIVSFSAGALMGDAFLHLLPESIEHGFSLQTSIYILSGIIFGLITEKIIRWNHCHMPITKTHVHHFAIMNLIGDFVHNIIDGLIIGASYLVSIPTGIATSVAIILHEIPQEIGDFGILIHGGFDKKKALFLNFLTALSSAIGLIIALILAGELNQIQNFFIPFAIGTFIYIAGADLIPELHKENKYQQTILQILSFIGGIGIMMLLLLIE